MSANFVRRFLFDPGYETLLEIESVNILDLEPPAQLTGVGTGTHLQVAEFEDGPFTQYEVVSASDFRNTFGSFGYEYDGVVANNPSARERYVDGALNPEYWNGNGFVALANKKFRRLICLRVDTSVGEVEFTRVASLLGSDAVTFDLEPGEHLDIDVGAGAKVATFNATEGTDQSAVGAYPTVFTGGEKMNVTIDYGAHIIGPIDIVFQAVDQSQAQVMARINSVLGYTAATDAGGDKTDLTGRRRGTLATVTINSVDAAVTAAVGFSAGANAGTGNVGDIDEVTVAEVDTLINAAESSANAERDAENKLRLVTTEPTLEVLAATTAVGLGFTIPSTASSASGNAGFIPAGTRVRNGSAVEWVTMQTIAIAADDAGPYSVKVRPAVDDGTTLGSVTNSVEVLPFPIALDAFTVTNPLPLDAALTETQLDTAYRTAILSTKSVSQVGKQANFVGSARMSNLLRTTVKTNALEASAEGAFGRIGVIRPPLGTTRQVARGTAQPGVGSNREQRIIYAYPGSATFISQIAQRGTAGGSGFTADGIIDVGSDTFVASLLSQLPPEFNPGQLTTFLTGMLSVEENNDDVQDLGIGDYKAFKAAGIMAPRFADGTPIFQSGVTSVDPLLNPQLKNVHRRRMADFIQDTLALRLTVFGKQPNTVSKRAAILAEVRAFLKDLKDAERIVDFSVTIGSDRAEIQLGIFRLIIKVTTISSLDSIVLETTIGESVVIEEAA